MGTYIYLGTGRKNTSLEIQIYVACKKEYKNYDDLHKKGCTNKFYVLLYMQTVDMLFLKRFT